MSMVYLGISFGPKIYQDVLGISRDILFDLKLYRDIAYHGITQYVLISAKYISV